MAFFRSAAALLLFSLAACAPAEEEDETGSQSGAQVAAPPPAQWFEFTAKKSGNPWDACAPLPDAPKTNESLEGAKVRSCIGAQGITFGTIAFLQPKEKVAACTAAASTCPRGDVLVVEVTRGADKIKSLAGWKPIARRTYLSPACSNATFMTNSAAEQVAAAPKILAFAEENDIDVTHAGMGFVPANAPACGFRAIVFPTAASAALTKTAEDALLMRGFRKVTTIPGT